jgi:hypothetical protein
VTKKVVGVFVRFRAPLQQHNHFTAVNEAVEIAKTNSYNS